MEKRRYAQLAQPVVNVAIMENMERNFPGFHAKIEESCKNMGTE